MVPCLFNNKTTYSKQSTSNVFITIVFSVSANFKRTCANFCIHYASNFKVFPVRMFFDLNARFFRIKAVALKIKQSRVRSPGNMLDNILLSIFY